MNREQLAELVLSGRQRDDRRYLREVGVGGRARQEAQVLVTRFPAITAKPGSLASALAEATGCKGLL